jgi:hypothetical protein
MTATGQAIGWEHEFGTCRDERDPELCAACQEAAKRRAMPMRVRRVFGSQVWEILVPECDRAGRRFPLRAHNEWDAKCRELTGGGMTIMSVAKGEWVRPDPPGRTVVREAMIPVMLMADRATMDRIARFTMDHYDQDAVLYYLVSEDAFMAERGKDAQDT